MLDNGEKVIWKYLLTHGQVVKEKNYYGGWDIPVGNKTEKCRDLVEEVGIDWSKTKGVQQDQEYEFTDTFHDAEYVSVLKGELVLEDGSKWKWGMDFDEPLNILDLVKDLLPDPFEN